MAFFGIIWDFSGFVQYISGLFGILGDRLGILLRFSGFFRINSSNSNIEIVIFEPIQKISGSLLGFLGIPSNHSNISGLRGRLEIVQDPSGFFKDSWRSLKKKSLATSLNGSAKLQSSTTLQRCNCLHFHPNGNVAIKLPSSLLLFSLEQK